MSLYSNAVVYRPPLERDSILLETACGCSYRACAFCDFIRDEFRLIPLEQIRENACKLGRQEPEKESLFLLGQNVLSRDGDELPAILDCVREFLPAVRRVNCYGRIDDILKKGPRRMADLKAAGLNALHIGVESGCDAVLREMNKGFTAADTRIALGMLEEAGLSYHVTYILGLGGKARSEGHVRDTTALLGAIRPLSIWALALKLWPGTPLAGEAAAGRFIPLSAEEMLLEERMILSQARTGECFYMDTTALGKYTLMGVLPGGKEKILEGIDRLLSITAEDGFTV